MEDKKLCSTIRIYNILIDGMCTNGKLMTARELFYSLATKGLKPDACTYNTMIKGLCAGGLINEASALLKEMIEKGCSPNNFTYNTILQGLLRHNETSKAMELLQVMVSNGISAHATTAAMLVNLSSANPTDETLKEMLQKLL
jgi:pentatricopeptide repeat protein